MVLTLNAFELAYCALAMLIAYGLRGSTGFGGALGMPLLALVIPIKVLVPVWTLMGIASSIAILGRDRRHIDWKACAAYVPWCLIGLLPGLYLFQALDSAMLARALALVIMVYGVHVVWTTVRPAIDRRRIMRTVEPVAGMLSGAVGTVFGTMGSVFMAMFLEARHLEKTSFRATMSAMLLALSVARGAGYYATGEFTRQAWLTFAALVPLMLAGIWLGDRVHTRLSDVAFKRLVGVTLILCGIPLFMK